MCLLACFSSVFHGRLHLPSASSSHAQLSELFHPHLPAFPLFQRWNGDEWEPEPHLMDDQALIANVRGKGTVVLTGCGHSGIVNIVRRACALTGNDTVFAVIGGFHMPSPAFDAVVPATIDALRTFEPSVLMPGHCTGYKAQQAIANAMPEAYVHGSVGTTIIL